MAARFLVLVVWLSMAAAVWGDCPGETRAERFGAYQAQWDNDSFDADALRDRDYTNGLRFSWIRNPCKRAAPRWAEKLAALWCRTGLCGDGEQRVDFGYALGQSIYTPELFQDDEVEPPRPRPTVPPRQPYDRPYAGHLYLSWLIQTTEWEGAVERQQTTIELQAGVVGPHAYGENVQNGWHRLLREREAPGWRYQLEEEPTLNANLRWRRKFGNRHIDLIPHGGVNLGTVSTHLDLGATLRLGTNLTQLPQFGLPQKRRSAAKDEFPIEAFVFVTIDARYVAHNIFLDGGVFQKRDDLRIDPESLVYDVKAGVAVLVKPWNLTFHYSRIDRSREFESRFPTGNGEQTFQSFAITRHLTRP